MNEIEAFISSTKKARVEIIPLIDVVFFLLATFVLFTLSLNKIGSVDVTMPIPQKGDPSEDSNVSIQASANGTFFWKQGSTGVPELITAAELRPRLEQYRHSVPVPRVFVRGDRQATFGAAVRVLDLVRAVGIEQVSIETVPSGAGS